MRFLFRSLPSLNLSRYAELPLLIRLAGLYFLIMCSLGILKPIKNAFALVGLANTQFYRVYLISALVVLVVPIYSRLADRVPLRWLVPGIALFFALNLLLFRAFYLDGSLAFGLIFYGWYDLFAAVLVTQFFLATQTIFDPRTARRAYPLVIGGGALGATLGGAITGFFAQLLQTPNLLLVAAGFLVAFIFVVPTRWATAAAEAVPQQEKLSTSELRTLLRNPHVRLIAATVVVGLLVKQLVDYQFNTITGEVFQTRDAISAFQGKFNAATQWLPLLALVVVRPLLQRWGVGSVLFLLPVALLGANLGLALSWTLTAAVVAKAADISLRHTAERAGREILYLPVPESIKLKAKVYIDVAIEEGLGKALSAGLIFTLLLVLDYQRVGYAGAGLAALWLLTAIAVQREYVRTLAQSIQGRVASLRGLFTSMTDASTLPVVRQALASGDSLQAAFAIDLLDEADPATVQPVCEELHGLLDHASPDMRERALAMLARVPAAIDFARVREKVSDPARRVREAAIHALCAARPAEADRILRELLGSPDAQVRTAALACLVPGEVGEVTQDVAQLIGTSYIEGRSEASRQGDVEARIEIALAAGTLGSDPRVVEILDPLLADPHPRVAAAALQSAGLLGRREFYPRIISALRTPQTREAAREALLLQGPRVVGALAERLLDQRADPVERRYIPAVLAGMPAQATVEVLLRWLEAPETDELLDYRILKALNKLRVRHPELEFD
ncbi:MAG TPA: HEAT repeat domain-containing protein, partial [Longimicrobiaceae bacterium]|nr:HEAT repeat domain-containing protein [Longimicrobiaceae bacterium]